jgi:uncharacterized surface protein with fasciclin (FAS1) repeats
MKLKYIAITLPLVMILHSCEVVDTYVDELHDIEHQREESVPDSSSDEDKTLFEITKNSHDFTILTEAVQHADLQDSLDGNTPYTLFAPTDEAFHLLFKELDISAEEFLAGEYIGALKNTLLYHILPGLNRIEELLDKGSVHTLKDEILQIRSIDGQVFAGHDDHNYALIIKQDVIAGNGVMHIIESVMSPSGDPGEGRDDEEGSPPETGDEENEESEFSDEEEEAPRDEEESDQGDEEEPDHGDDEDSGEEDNPSEEDDPADEIDFENYTLIEILDYQDDFSMFRKAIQVTGLENEFQSGSQNSIFVPVNQAFRNYLSNSDISEDELFDESNREFLRNIVLYHIMPGYRDSGHIINRKQVRTANQSFVSVLQEEGLLYVGNDRNGFAKVLELDIQASNGIIHIIDGVLIP